MQIRYLELLNDAGRRSTLEFRDALHEWDHVPSVLKFEGSTVRVPLLTIAITTYQRPIFLVEALTSVLSQRTDHAFEIVVLDNDPASQCLDYVLKCLPALRTSNFRYFINSENIGMYGNVNRCVPVARGEWLTILHDDDLFRENFVEAMIAELKQVPAAQGIVAREAIIDQRPISEQTIVESLPRLTARYAGRLTLKGPTGWVTIASRVYQRLLDETIAREMQWLGRTSRRIRPAALFAGPVLGNGSGFVFLTAIAKEVGGYYPEEFPASDLTFFARFAMRYHLRELREQVCIYRVAENESLKPETARHGFLWFYLLQKDMAGTVVPRWYLHFSPVIIEYWRVMCRSHWRIDIPREEVEALLGLKLPKRNRSNLVRQIRLLLSAI